MDHASSCASFIFPLGDCFLVNQPMIKEAKVLLVTISLKLGILFIHSLLPATGGTEKSNTCAPDPLASHSKALKSLFIIFGLLHLCLPERSIANSNLTAVLGKEVFS